MSKELWKIVTDNEYATNNYDKLDLKMAMQCAPLITGLKTSNLLNIDREDYDDMKEIVKNTPLSWYLLYETDNKVTVLLFHRRKLVSYLMKDKVRDMLRKDGYTDLTFSNILARFSARYREYMITKSLFPHEMGLLLGYPTEDVEGFIEHQGDKCLCVGYWKVYANREKKERLFVMFEQAKERLIQLLSYGYRMVDIINMCCTHEDEVVLINY